MSGQEAFREQVLQEESFASNLELHLFILSCLIVLIIVCSPWSVSCDRACWLPPSFVFSCIPPTAISCLCFCLFSGIMPFPFMGFLFSTWTRCLQVSWLWAISATIVAEILNILMRKTAGRSGGGEGGAGMTASQRMTWKPNLVSHLTPYKEHTGKKNTFWNNTLHTSSWHKQLNEKPVHKTQVLQFKSSLGHQLSAISLFYLTV